jgi:streptogramin lyase
MANATGRRERAISEFSAGRQTYGIAYQDGCIFYTDSGTPGLGRINPTGQRTNYQLPTLAEHAFGIALQSDGHIWISEWSNQSETQPWVQLISRISQDGTTYHVHPVAEHGNPRQLWCGTDDVLWFTAGGVLGCIEPGEQPKYFPPPFRSPWRTIEANAIVGTSGGLLWIGFSNSIASFSPSSQTWNHFPMPSEEIPNMLSIGPDGAVWFTDFHHGKLGKLDNSGAIEIFDAPGSPFGITTTSDEEIWITEFSGNRITRIDPQTGDLVDTVELPTAACQPQMLISGDAGELWYSMQTGGVGRVILEATGSSGKTTLNEETILVSPPFLFPQEYVRGIAIQEPPPAVSLEPSPESVWASFSRHPSFLTPPGETVIWRYLDIGKFLEMLRSSSLFFSRLDLHEDPHEGTLPEGLTGFAMGLEHFRPRALINCWHLNPFESFAMWDLYAAKGSGIAIRSTVEDLVASLTHPEDADGSSSVDPFEAPLFVGSVRYMDYAAPAVPPPTALSYLTYKRMSYEHEREVRAVVLPANPLLGGQNISCDLDRLIRSVHVAPQAPVWWRPMLEDAMRRYGLNKSVTPSSERRSEHRIG